LIVALTIAIGLFFGVWWMDDATWVPAGLAALVVLLIFFSAREVVMRRAWTRYLLDQDSREHASKESSRKGSSSKSAYSSGQHANALRAIQKQSAEADASTVPPEVHLDLFHLCQDYVANTDEAMHSNNLTAEGRMALRAGQEKVRSLQKHHLLTWARDASRAQTHEAQQRARTFDKIETANRAIDCLDNALKAYPGEAELEASKIAIREFIASVKVAHWVELAERSAFKGHHRRAIERYQDALFYLNRETVNDEIRLAGSERIMREIDLLRAHLKAVGKSEKERTAERKSN
jgi:tetratricopeptide (TPR) repeat protein